MPIVRKFPRFKTGKRNQDAWFEKVAAELTAARNISGPGVRVTPFGTQILNAASASITGTWFTINGTAGIDGGYPWQPIAQYPVIEVTAPGSGYTGATASWSGGNGASATLAVQLGTGATVGQVVAVTPTADGTGFFTQSPVATITISGTGTGATAVVKGVAWQNSGSAVSGPSGLVYEARGCRSVPVDGTPYLAVPGPGGQLLFFCRPAILCQTQVYSSYPTSTGVYYNVRPLFVTGTESEGSTASASVFGASFFALHQGVTVPPLGTDVLCRFVANRWVFRFD